VSGVNYFSLSTTTIFPYRLNLPFAFCSPPAADGRQPDRRGEGFLLPADTEP